LGGAWRSAGVPKNLLERIALFGEIEKSVYHSPIERLGIEWGARWVWLRAGYQNLPSQNNAITDRLSLGAGLQLRDWRIDYAWVPNDLLGDEQSISVTWRFGLSPDERQRLAAQIDDAVRAQSRQRSQSFYEAGQAATKNGDWHLAVEQFSKSLDWNPDNSAAAQALTEAKKHVDLAGNEAATAKARAKRLEKEVEALKKETQILKDTADRLSRDAYARFQAGQTDEAIELWERATAIDPSNSDAQAALRQAREKKSVTRGAPPADAAASIEHLNAEAMSAYRAGDRLKARAYLRQALSIDPSDTRTKNNLERINNELENGTAK
jgi:tetratricopeptide (TPR) repeat protein